MISSSLVAKLFRASAKILAHIILDDPRLRSYADISRKAFGPQSTPLTSVLFCMELFTVRFVSWISRLLFSFMLKWVYSVVLVTLYADSLHGVFPTYSANVYKLWGLIM